MAGKKRSPFHITVIDFLITLSEQKGAVPKDHLRNQHQIYGCLNLMEKSDIPVSAIKQMLGLTEKIELLYVRRAAKRILNERLRETTDNSSKEMGGSQGGQPQATEDEVDQALDKRLKL